jgi:hypothetical protein
MSDNINVNGHERLTREQSLQILAAMTKPASEDDWFKKTFLPTMARFIESRVQPLRQRIDELENAQREFCYCGVWATGSYKRGNFVTHDGSLWHCDADNTDTKPGTDASAWTLCVKRGKDAR